eukprot:1066449-Rhodomonas_salina.3
MTEVLTYEECRGRRGTKCQAQLGKKGGVKGQEGCLNSMHVVDRKVLRHVEYSCAPCATNPQSPALPANTSATDSLQPEGTVCIQRERLRH